jgi:DNA polymerase III epsilon subunit family exonuclease
MTALDTPLNLVPFVSIDVETTGLNPQSDAIVEIGAVKAQGGRIIEEFCTLVYVDRTIPLGARRVHGISNEMLVGKPRIREALAMLWQFAGDGALVEHSYQAFDALFLEKAHGSSLTMPYINTCSLSRRLFPHVPKHGLEECCRRFRIANADQQRALGDARATASLLLCLLELCSTRYPRLQDLVAVASIERETGRPSRRRHHRSWHRA